MDKKEADEYLRNLRRDKIQSLLCASPSISQTQIAKTLSLPVSTVHDDVVWLKQRARDYVREFDSHFSYEYSNCLMMLGQLQQEAWLAIKQSKYERNKAQLINVLREIIMNRAALLCDVSLVGKTADYLEGLRKRKDHLIGLPSPTDGVLEQPITQLIESTDTEEHEEGIGITTAVSPTADTDDVEEEAT